jgi:hexokinase
MDITELKTIQQNFTKELELSGRGTKTSLPFIIHQLPEQPLIQEGESFFVLVIGGSVYQSALCRKERGQTIITKKKAGTNPPFKSGADFLDFCEQHIPKDISTIALNFAYPMAPIFRNNNLLDGRLTGGSKEYTFDGLVGKVVGEEVEKYIKEKQGRDVRVAVANDTICELLSGLSSVNKPEYLACGIAGTGINFAFFTDAVHAVNLESANFDKFQISKYGKMIDETSVEPGTALFEKEVSGAYLHQHFNLFTKELGIDSTIESTKNLDEFVQKCDIGEDGEACKFAYDLVDRSAALVAAQVAGITAYKNTDMNFIMAGSLFWKGFGFRDKVQQYVKQLLPEHSVTFLLIESCEIYGAAKLIA